MRACVHVRYVLLFSFSPSLSLMSLLLAVAVVIVAAAVVAVYSVDIVYFWQYVAEQTADKHRHLLTIKH